MTPGKGSWEEARALMETETGPVTSVRVLSSGRNSEISVIVHAAGEATFVKGRRADHPQAWTQERERAVNPLVQHVSPRLKWATADDVWSLLGYEPAPGAHADYRPDSPDLPKVADALRQLQDVVLPGGIEVKQAEDRWRAYTDRPELLIGPALLHTDWTPSNVLVSDRARLVDWAWPTRGAAWIDPACWTVWLIASGHTPGSAESWAARIPSWLHAPADALDEYARIQARMWDSIDAESTEDWTATLAHAAHQWADHRDNRLPSARRPCMNDTTTPQIHPTERLTTPDGTSADIDVEIVPLVRALWWLGLATTASCQDFGEGTAGQRNANPRPSWYGGDAFIAYHTGWAWLKMPVPDTLRLSNLLLGTDFHDRIARRWQRGSWRMHIPVVFDDNHGIGPDTTAQIHFPKDQVPDLTQVLEHMTGERQTVVRQHAATHRDHCPITR